MQLPRQLLASAALAMCLMAVCIEGCPLCGSPIPARLFCRKMEWVSAVTRRTFECREPGCSLDVYMTTYTCEECGTKHRVSWEPCPMHDKQVVLPAGPDEL
ncbi:hypothetical protein PGTUg99_031332 [Puccinia graminis f. sp. tritici]|uniref:Uncharacterized protein n=2 Tax=Puccinia graminis f. sp. tritici TaxID=56615 RepID=A0A5B0SB53_PUCGR|nr:hypothetical protein PGTUg99_031332 [Puccinia graminis f. sp. tritici]